MNNQINQTTKISNVLNPEEKSEVLLTVGMVILHYRRSCQNGDDEGNWCVGMLNSSNEDVLLKLTDQCKITNPLIFDTIGYWKVNSKKITDAALKKLKDKGFITKKASRRADNQGKETHIFIYRKSVSD